MFSPQTAELPKQISSQLAPGEHGEALRLPLHRAPVASSAGFAGLLVRGLLLAKLFQAGSVLRDARGMGWPRYGMLVVVAGGVLR